MKTTTKYAATALMALAITASSLSPAEARGWDHHGGWGRGHGGGGLVTGLVAGVAGAAVALATLPFVVVGDAVSSAPEPVVQTYYQPAPAPVYQQAPVYQPAYQPAPAYYAQPQRVVYAAPAYYPAYGYRYGYYR